MKKKINEEISIPEGVTCHVEHKVLTCTGGSRSVKRNLVLPDGAVCSVKDKSVFISSSKVNKKDIAVIKSVVAHIKNMFRGVNEEFVYEMEICNVHFPMTVKIEGSKFIVNNFLGEKEKRIAEIRPDVKVEVKGQKVIVSGHDIESTGQTAANIEKATWVSKRDRRVFQDGIFITSKCGRPI